MLHVSHQQSWIVSCAHITNHDPLPLVVFSSPTPSSHAYRQPSHCCKHNSSSVSDWRCAYRQQHRLSHTGSVDLSPTGRVDTRLLLVRSLLQYDPRWLADSISVEGYSFDVASLTASAMKASLPQCWSTDGIIILNIVISSFLRVGLPTDCTFSRARPLSVLVPCASTDCMHSANSLISRTLTVFTLLRAPTQQCQLLPVRTSPTPRSRPMQPTECMIPSHVGAMPVC